MNMKNGTVLGDHEYHSKQKDYKASAREEIRAIYQENMGEIEAKTTDMVNKIPEKELYYQLAEHKESYAKNIGRFTDGIAIDRYAIDRDPLLSKFQKTFEAQMMANASQENVVGFMKNSYSGYGASAHFMIRSLSYIYPMLIIKPLPKLTWREDWPVFSGSAWSAFDVFLTASRIYNATNVNEQGTDSGRVQAQFGESIFQNVTIRQDLIWDSTVEMYADQYMNNGLVNYVYMESMKRGFDEQINDIYLFGDTDYNMQGLLTNTNIQRINSGGSWNQYNPATSEKWTTTDLINLTQQVEQGSNGVYTAKKIMMGLKLKPYVIQPRSAYVSTSPVGYVAGQEWGEDFSAMLKGTRYNPYLNGQATTSGEQIAIAYDVDTSFAHIGVPVFMYAEPLSYESHKYKIPFITRTGGFRVIQSPSIAILDNISTV
jgi:hypothetical protein